MLLFFFSFLFVSGFLVLIIVPAFFQSSISGMADLVNRLLYFALISLLLVASFWLRSGGSRRQRRVFWTILSALIVAFPFAAVGVVVARAILGLSGASSFIPLYFVGLAVGVIIGYWLSGRVTEEEKPISDPDQS